MIVQPLRRILTQIYDMYKQTKIKMSKTALADFLYATLMTRARITDSFGIGIYQYSRKQNARHNVEIMIQIDEDQVDKFEQLSGTTLGDPIEILLNNKPQQLDEDIQEIVNNNFWEMVEGD